jgi:hypothetical protein
MVKLSVALGAAVLTATVLTRAAFAIVPDQPPVDSESAPAVSCLSGPAGVTVVPGEIVSPRERDARVGWLALTYIGDARTALQEDRGREAVELMVQAQRLLDTTEQCAREASDDSAPAAHAAASLARAEAVLASGDRASAAQDLTNAARSLDPWLASLDAVLSSPATANQ